MSDATPQLTPTTTPERRTLEDLPALATRINKEHEQLIESTRHIVHRAIGIGEALKDAKAKSGHGNFLKWVEVNCKFSDKTAQRYMKLAENKHKIGAPDKFETISNLTLNEAERLIDAEATGTTTPSTTGSTTNNKGKKGIPKNTSDTYDKVQEKLIEKLKSLGLNEAETAVKETINKLNNTLKDIKQIVSNATPKAT
jgi:hypothetical protein